MPALAEDRHNRIVQSPSGPYIVRCRPRGAELRDAVDQPEILNWLTAWPGVLGLLGLLLHWTIYRRQWVVTAGVPSAVGRPTGSHVVFVGRRDEAKRRFEALLAELKQGNSPGDVNPSR
jgi:hypothetical protein